MTKLDVHVGGTFADSKERVLKAVGRALAGESLKEDHITFATWDTLAGVMTTKRFELLRFLHRNPQANVAALARNLKRDYKRVHNDVTALMDAGLIESINGSLQTQYNEIRTSIAL
jgi:predicted transcriptional regulator